MTIWLSVKGWEQRARPLKQLLTNAFTERDSEVLSKDETWQASVWRQTQQINLPEKVLSTTDR